MTPNLNPVGFNKPDQQAKDNNLKANKLSVEKGRSTSVTSSSRGRKYSLFNSIKSKNESKTNISKMQ